MSLEDHYGDILQKARAGHGWSLDEVASRADVAAYRIASFEAASGRPAPDELRRLAVVLELAPDRLAAIAEERWQPHPLSPSDSVLTVVGALGGYAVNSYLLVDPRAREAAAVDTANAPDRIVATAQQAGLRITTLLLTHAHPDHIGGVDRLQSATGARLVAHPLDRSALDTIWNDRRDLIATEFGRVSIGAHEVEIRWVPGHTHSGVCYRAGQALFVGDCLFAGSVGRARSPADYQALLKGIRTKLLALPEETAIFPGHGPPTTVGEERRHNPFFE